MGIQKKIIKIISYEKYGELIFSKQLIPLYMHYSGKYIVVMDQDGNKWKVVCDIKTTNISLIKVL